MNADTPRCCCGSCDLKRGCLTFATIMLVVSCVCLFVCHVCLLVDLEEGIHLIRRNYRYRNGVDNIDTAGEIHNRGFANIRKRRGDGTYNGWLIDVLADMHIENRSPYGVYSDSFNTRGPPSVESKNDENDAGKNNKLDSFGAVDKSNENDVKKKTFQYDSMWKDREYSRSHPVSGGSGKNLKEARVNPMLERWSDPARPLDPPLHPVGERTVWLVFYYVFFCYIAIDALLVYGLVREKAELLLPCLVIHGVVFCCWSLGGLACLIVGLVNLRLELGFLCGVGFVCGCVAVAGWFGWSHVLPFYRLIKDRQQPHGHDVGKRDVEADHQTEASAPFSQV